MNNNSNSNRPSSDIPWFAIIVAFGIFWPVGVALLIYKLSQEGKADQRRQDWLNSLNSTRQTSHYSNTSAQRGTSAQQAAPSSAGKGRTDNPTVSRAASTASRTRNYTPTRSASSTSSNRKKIKDGKLFTILGIIIFLVFGLGAMDEVMFWLPHYPLQAIKDALIPFVCSGVGVGMFVWGRFKNRQARRFRKLLNLIGDSSRVDIGTLAEAMPCSYDQACESIQNMIDAGLLGERAYIDMSTGLLELDGRGVASKPRKQEAKPKTPEEERQEDKSVLQEIRRVNDSIPDPELSRKIDRIEEITGHILDYQKKHPDKAGELHKFLNYYLPTTLKILNAYAELDQQGVDGDNINTTKDRIEGMMDLVVEGFEKQLDKLFEGDMMDISSDISVMEKMLNHDGLAGGIKMPRAEDEGIHLTLDPEPIPTADSWTTPVTQPADPTSGIQLTLDPEGGSAAAQAPAPDASWADSFYRQTKEDLEKNS